MSIPPFSRGGLLPAGVHDCTLEEVRTALAFTDRRQRLIAGLDELLGVLPDRNLVSYSLIDGSFAEDRPEPHDIDIVLVVGALNDDGPAANLVSWVASRKSLIKFRFGCDLYVADEELAQDYWIGLFGHTRDGRSKGMLRISSMAAGSP